MVLLIGHIFKSRWQLLNKHFACVHKCSERPLRTLCLVTSCALRALKQDAKSPFIFVSERGAPFTVSGLQKMIERAGIEAKMPFKVHSHMLRHAAGYVLANKGTDTRTLQSYLGHRSIQSTVRYTELAPERFKNLWRCAGAVRLLGPQPFFTFHGRCPDELASAAIASHSAASLSPLCIRT
jgi:hypothetical protein